MNNTHLILRDGSKLQWLEKDYKYYLRKMTLIYGGSGTGKSTILDEILFLLKPYIPICFAIAPTNSSNNTFTGKIPKHNIRDGRNLDKLSEWLEKFMERQKNITEIYCNSNNLDNLKSLFDRISDDMARKIEKSIIKKARDSLIFMESSEDITFAQKKAQKTDINKEKQKILRELYKTTIRHNKISLENDKTLNKKEKAALKFLDINPHVLLILDDCASKFKKLYKKTNVIKEIFYEGRHNFITTIITTQDDKEIESELRKNSMVNIYTSDQTAAAVFERSSNSYPKHVKEKARLVIEKIFKQDETKPKHYQKMAYIQNLQDPFRYTIADMYEDFRMCSDSAWEFENKIGVGENINGLENNPFFEKYT